VNVNGFSLVELLAALALGLFVVAGAAALFADSGRHNAVLHARARLNDNARFALQFLSRDLRMAGFGCAAGSPALASVKKNQFRGDTVAVNYALFAEDITAGATVRAVRIGLLVRSLSSARVTGNPHREYGALPVDTATYNVLDRTVNPPNLRVMRRVAGATVKLRNR